MSPTVKAKFDNKLNGFISKKLMAWIVATVFLGMSWITNEQWYFITLLYLGVQAAIDVKKSFEK